MDASPKGAVELFHGYTYSGIPVSVAAALAVQDIIEKEDIFSRAKEMAPYFQKGLFTLKDIDVVEKHLKAVLHGGKLPQDAQKEFARKKRLIPTF